MVTGYKRFANTDLNIVTIAHGVKFIAQRKHPSHAYSTRDCRDESERREISEGIGCR